MEKRSVPLHLLHDFSDTYEKIQQQYDEPKILKKLSMMTTRILKELNHKEILAIEITEKRKKRDESDVTANLAADGQLVYIVYCYFMIGFWLPEFKENYDVSDTLLNVRSYGCTVNASLLCWWI